MSRFSVIENCVVVNQVESDVYFASQQGWIPAGYSAIGDLWDGNRYHKPPPSPTTFEEYTSAVQAHLDATARERNYDGILSACTYATSSVPKFAAEGHTCVAWRDAVWATCYQILGEVESGQRPAPSVEDLIALLPIMTWPEVV